MRLWRRRRDERGVTLIELVIVTAMMSIVSIMVYTVLIDSTQTAARADNSTRAENNGRLALRTISEDLRSAVQIRASSSTTACPTGLSYPAGFTSCIGFLIPHEVSANATTTTIAAGAAPIGCPYSNITYGLKSGVLLEDRTNYNDSCVATSVVTGRTILTGIDNSSSSLPLFTFYDTFGNQLGTANTVADFQRAGSVSIQIALTYQKGAPDIALMTTAALRNDR
jgi:prepilin-type N-terminal cleavage/methylation domain-containing protein